MAEKVEVFSGKARKSGIFSYSALYNFFFTVLKDEGYIISEDKYVEKDKGETKDLEVKWTAKKKITDYFRNEIKVSFRIFHMKEVEAEENGKKIKTNKGDLTISVSASLERDYEGKWEESPLYKFFRGIYDRYIIRTTMDEYEDKLAEKADGYTEEVKAFLNLEGRK